MAKSEPNRASKKTTGRQSIHRDVNRICDWYKAFKPADFEAHIQVHRAASTIAKFSELCIDKDGFARLRYRNHVMAPRGAMKDGALTEANIKTLHLPKNITANIRFPPTQYREEKPCDSTTLSIL